MLSKTTYTITDPATLAYAFTFDWVRASHLEFYVNDVAVPSSDPE